MKRQNLVMLTGKLADYAEQTDPVGGKPAYVITATLATDHPAYGGHHRVLFADRLALELRAFREVSQAASLEVTVDGWLRSQRAGVAARLLPWWSPIGSCTT